MIRKSVRSWLCGIKKEYWIALSVCLALAFLWYAMMNSAIREVFHYEGVGQKIQLGAYMGAGFLLVVGFLFSVYYFVRNYRKHRAFVKYFLIYFGITTLLLAIGWPGIFRGDEFYVIPKVTNMGFEYIQHYFTNLFYAVSLAIIPTLGGIVFVQIVIISAIVAYVLANIEKILKHPKLTYLVLVVFLLPPVVDANLFTLRATLTGYLFLLTICQLVLYSMNPTETRRLAYIGILCTIFANWKSEFLYVPILIVVYLLIFYRKQLDLKKFFCRLVAFVVAFYCLSLPQKNLKNYLMTLVANPLSMMVVDDDIMDSMSDDMIENIEAVVSIEVLKDGSAYQDVLTLKKFRQDYTEDEERAFYKTFVQLVLMHPMDFLKIKAKTYAATNFPQEGEWANHTGHEDVAAQWTLNLSDGTYLRDNFKYTSNVFGEGFKRSFVSFLQMRDDNYNPIFLHKIIYNTTIPVMLCMILMIAFAIRRRWKKFWIIGVSILQFVVIFLSAPANFWMYYFCVYLIGCIIIVYTMVRFIDNRIKIGGIKK